MATITGGYELPEVNPAARIVVVAAGLATILITLFVAARSVANGAMVHSFYYDDFYYYAQIARNIHDRGVSTFDGTTLTNGYHPLWMALLVGLSFLIDIRPGAFFIALCGLSAVLHLIGTLRLHSLLRSQFPESSLVDTATVLYFFLGFLLAVSGMEVVLLFALFPFLAAYWLRFAERCDTRAAAQFGALGALLVFARLDAAIFVALLFAAAVAVFLAARTVPVARWAAALGTAATVCGAPIILYLALNYTVFGSALPVSGLAKALRTEHGFSLMALESLAPHNLLGVILPFGTLVLTICGLAFAAANVRQGRAIGWLSFAILLFPVLFLGITAWRSDWVISPWYYYPLIFAAPFAVMVIGMRLERVLPDYPRSTWGSWIAAGVAIVMALGIGVKSLNGAVISDELSLQEANQLQPFAHDHPGTYAMGDSAALFGFLLQRPVVHLEGLAADHRMLDYIGRSASLADVMTAYKVRYYVTVGVGANAQPEDGCWRVAEPTRAGTMAPKMRGRFCDTPVLDLVTEYSGVNRRLLVFDATAVR